jgi:hypothetical protein
MTARATRWFVLALLSISAVSMLWAQQPPGGFGGGRGGPPGSGSYRGRGGPGGYGSRGGGEEKKEEFKLPEDQRLLKIHESFVREAEKLALEYERDNQLDKARACYEEILRLVPVYAQAQAALDKVRTKQYSAESKGFEVLANKGWQDTGVVVAAGKPVHIKADGKWTFRLSHELTADGIEIPEELQAFRLGSLIAMVDDGQSSKDNAPFLVGSNKEFVAERTGKLMLRMYDADPSDNQGKMKVLVSGTFFHPGKN